MLTISGGAAAARRLPNLLISVTKSVMASPVKFVMTEPVS